MINRLKERIKLESKHGDIAEVCRRVGVTRTVFHTALEKGDYNELTAKEEEVLLAFIELLNERRTRLEGI